MAGGDGAEEREARYRDEGYWRDDLLTALLYSHAQAKPEQRAVIDGKVRITWSGLLTAARKAAGALSAAGVGPDDVVSTQLPNGADIVILHLGIELLGAIHNPLAIQFREHELTQIAKLVEPKLVVHPGTLDGIDYAAIHAGADFGTGGVAGVEQ
ncbi:MAG: AMP-binding protein, partial [Acidimicrobiales bacterium]